MFRFCFRFLTVTQLFVGPARPGRIRPQAVAPIGVGFFLALALAGCTKAPSSGLHAVVEAQRARYPEMEVQDWYKLLHQAAMGNRHLGVEDSLIYQYLLDEMDRIAAREQEPLVEYLSPDSAVVRINLRPFKAQGGSPDELFGAMKATWDEVVPAPEVLQDYWTELEAMEPFPFEPDELAAYFSTRQAESFPAVHHSERYEAAYRPAYRVLLRRFIPETPSDR